jgi:hypothetical protein
VRRTLFRVRFLALIAIAAVAGAWPIAAQAVAAPSLLSAARFTILSAAPGGGGAVACTDGSISGDVGSSGGMAAVVPIRCPIAGAIVAPVSTQVVNDFNTAYAGYASIACGETLTGTLDGIHRGPGVYCVDAVAKTGTLTLTGSGPWIFKVAAIPATIPATGALTGTGFSVVTTNPCNVNWWVAQAVGMTDSNLVGTVLAGAAITMTRGTFHGAALAKAGVTTTGTVVTGCVAGTPGEQQGEHQDNNQGENHQDNHQDEHKSEEQKHESEPASSTERKHAAKDE